MFLLFVLYFFTFCLFRFLPFLLFHFCVFALLSLPPLFLLSSTLSLSLFQFETIDRGVSWLLRSHAVNVGFTIPGLCRGDVEYLVHSLDWLENNKHVNGYSSRERCALLLHYAEQLLRETEQALGVPEKERLPWRLNRTRMKLKKCKARPKTQSSAYFHKTTDDGESHSEAYSEFSDSDNDLEARTSTGIGTGSASTTSSLYSSERLFDSGSDIGTSLIESSLLGSSLLGSTASCALSSSDGCYSEVSGFSGSHLSSSDLCEHEHSGDMSENYDRYNGNDVAMTIGGVITRSGLSPRNIGMSDRFGSSHSLTSMISTDSIESRQCGEECRIGKKSISGVVKTGNTITGAIEECPGTKCEPGLFMQKACIRMSSSDTLHSPRSLGEALFAAATLCDTAKALGT